MVYLAWRLHVIPEVRERSGLFMGFLARAPSLWQTFRFAFFDVFFRYSASDTLLPPLWTMTYEIAGSAAILAALAVAGTLRWRMAAYLLLSALAYCVEPFYCSFLVGVLVAEVYIMDEFARLKRLIRLAAPILIVAAVILAAQLPGKNEPFYLCVSTMFFIGCVFSRRSRRFFENGASLFLGRISYSLYLIQTVVLYTLALHLSAWSQNADYGAKGLITADGLTVIVSLLLARGLVIVDEASIAASRWIGRALTGA
jgi:peptidoglycan/LPS O-acetylase OafA/YrhL